MTIRYLLPLIMLTGCGPIPVQMQSSKQEQTQRTSQSAEQSADQQSAHQSEAKQGTNSMPVIIICNTTNSAGASCATLPKDNPLQPAIKRRITSEANN
jgi:starvation-inducible outer membrane lipoprotein